MDIDTYDQTRDCIHKIKKKNIHEFEEKLKNGTLSVIPSKLKFIFNSGNFKIQENTVEITNYFFKPCLIQFLPFETRYFRIKNIFQKIWLNPGSVFKMNILFVPDENRDYNDILRIRYFNDQTIQIKVYAKIMTKYFFPTTVNFGNVPLGRTIYYKIPIHPHTDKEFSFAIISSNGESCVDIYPRWGHIKTKQNPVIIMVIYRPLRYISMNFQIRIFISDLCRAPHVINFYAYTRPGLLRETLENIKSGIESKPQQEKVDLTICKEVKPISIKKDKVKYYLNESVTKLSSFEKLLLKQFSYFSSYTLHAVNCILNLTIRSSFNEHKLKGPLSAYLSKILMLKTQKLKEFLVKVEHCGKNEIVKFYHKSDVNYDSNENRIIKIKTQQKQVWDEYKDLITNSEKYLFEQQKLKKRRQRILRVCQKYPTSVSTSSQKEESFFHYCKILPFRQIARKVMLRNRLLKVLSKLRKMTPRLIHQYEEPLTERFSLTFQV